MFKDPNTILVIVDMQNYYINPDSDYCRYFDELYDNSLEYLHMRCKGIVLPNIRRLINLFRNNSKKILFLKLCSHKEDRSDLHNFFHDINKKAAKEGYNNLYPLCTDLMADITDELNPSENDLIITKTTYSPFSSTEIDTILHSEQITTLVFSGLSTSQCVETTARDASDRGYNVIHIEDAQADYDEITHIYSLISSRGVCGGVIYTTEEYIELVNRED